MGNHLMVGNPHVNPLGVILLLYLVHVAIAHDCQVHHLVHMLSIFV